MGTITDSQTYSRKLFTILAVIGLLGAQLAGVGLSPAHAAGVAGYITFSDGETTHKVDISDDDESTADITIEGYEWLGDGTNDGPTFHISCSATLLGTYAAVVGPPFADNYGGTAFEGWPEGTSQVEIVDFDISRQPGSGQTQECDPGTFDPQPAATVTLGEQCPTDEQSAGVTYTIANDGDGDVHWTLTGTAGGEDIDQSGTVAEGAANDTGFIALEEDDTYNLDLVASDSSEAELDSTSLEGTIDCEDPQPNSGIDLVKSADDTELVDPDVGDEVNYTFTITNTGEDALSGTELTDAIYDGLAELGDYDESGFDLGVLDDFGIDDAAGATLEVDEELVLTDAYTHAITQDDIDRGGIYNVATVTATGDDSGDEVSATDDELVTITTTPPPPPAAPEPGIEIVKTATDGVEIDEDGDPFLAFEGDETFDVTYSYEITNTGEDDLTDLSLVDDQIGELSTAFEEAVGDDTFEAGESVTVTAVHENVGADTFTDGQLINIAIVEGTGVESDETVDDSDDESIYDIEVLPLGSPSISIVKTAVEGENVTQDEEGNWVVDISNGNSTTVGYEYLITNTGDEDLTDLGLVDDQIGDLSEAFQQAVGDDTFEAGDSVTVTADYELTDADIEAGTVTNVADVDGIGVDTGLPATDSDDETVFVTEVQAEVITADEEDPEVAAETEVKAETLARTGTDSTNLLLLGLLFSLLGAAGLLLTPNRRGGPGMMQV